MNKGDFKGEVVLNSQKEEAVMHVEIQNIWWLVIWARIGQSSCIGPCGVAWHSGMAVRCEESCHSTIDVGRYAGERDGLEALLAEQMSAGVKT
jgi:hypothetical protein